MCIYGLNETEKKEARYQSIVCGISKYPVTLINQIIQGISYVVTNKEAAAEMLYISSMQFCSEEYAATYSKMVTDGKEAWEAEYTNVNSENQGEMIGTLIGDQVMRYLDLAGSVQGLKAFTKSGGLKAALTKMRNASTRLKNLLVSSPEAIFEMVKTVKRSGDNLILTTVDGSTLRYTVPNLETELASLGHLDEAGAKSALQNLFDGCFTGDTLVHTDQGGKRIDAVQEGDRVLSKDVTTGEIAYKTVRTVYVKSAIDFIHLKFVDETIKTTPSHLFFTNSGWWVSAKNLKPGDKIQTQNGIMKPLIAAITVEEPDDIPIYNLNVADFHTYFVGESGVLVHNDCTIEMGAAFKGAVDDARACGVNNADELAALGKASADGMRSGAISAGKFVDDVLEADYQKYIARKNGQGKAPRERSDWKQARDYWCNDSPMARGNAFNDKARLEQRYPYNEIHLENGKRLDSYNEDLREIVSRKATNLEEIQLETFEGYLKELQYKYKAGTKIRSNTNPDIDGHILQGKQYLEIPTSNQSFGRIKEYIDLAKSKYGIEIRFMEE